MYNLMVGQPGGGKSYEANVYHILPALQRGRKVITNLPVDVEFYAAIDASFRDLLEVRARPQPIRGTWTVGNDQAAFSLFPDGHTEEPKQGARVFGGVWDYWTDWKHEKGWGPLYVIDECHLPMPKLGTDPQVEEWYSLHRHFNADALLITQSYGKLSQAIRDSVQLVYRCKKAVAFGRPDSYIRKVQDGIRGEVVNTEIRKYEKQYFALYRSHTQGASAQEFNADDVVPIWKHWTFKGAAVCLVLVVCIFVFGDMRNPLKPPPPKKAEAAVIASSVPALGAPVPVAKVDVADVRKAEKYSVGGQLQPQSAVDAGDPEPLGGKGVHLTGSIQVGGVRRWMFVISQNGQRVATASSVELVEAGYSWRGAGDCVGYLTYAKTVRAISCDAPQIGVGIGGEGSGAKPAAKPSAKPSMASL